MELVSWTATVTARQITPSSLSHGWFVKNKILDLDDIKSPSVFTDGIVQFQSLPFALLVTQDFLQFAPSHGIEREGEMVAEKLGKILRGLPQTAYTAIGLNFVWHERIAEGKISAITRKLFFREDISIFKEFAYDTANFGSYMSMNWEILRLKLDIRPIVVNSGLGREDRLQFAFNFHKDITGSDGIGELESTLSLWERAKQRTQELVKLTLQNNLE